MKNKVNNQEYKVQFIIEELKKDFNIDKYNNIVSETWNPFMDSEKVFIDLILILKKLCPNITVLEFELIKSNCVSSFENEMNKTLRFETKMKDLIIYLIKENLFNIYF